MHAAAGSRFRHFANARWLYVIVLVALPFVVYSNNYRHAYVLDDGYTVLTNPSVRSLGAIPSYFVDPATYTTLREQADYRPVLQLTYALNYAMGGYDSWSWHFTQILLHALVALGVFALCRRMLVILRDPHLERIAFIAAAIFAVHPAAAGVVNYYNARSSLLTAAFLLPALLAYMQPIEDAKYARQQLKTAALFALALFTKVEAVGLLGALWAYELWQRQRETPDGGLLRAVRTSFDARTLRRLAPALAVTAVYFIIRWRVMAPFPFAETRHAADVGAYQYFATQLTAWWYYILRWVAPVRLVADYLAYPVFRTIWEPVVLLSGAAWIAVGALLIAAWRRAPYLLFLAVASLALLSPTSSIAPLAEMVNEHRPYLPIGILSLALVIPIGVGLRAWPAGHARAMLNAALVGVFLSLAALTYRRNEVFSTSRSYWGDVLAKAPSSRAHMNYGLVLMEANEMSGALREFHRSLEIAPNWYFTHINLGIAYQHVGKLDSARAYFDRAVELDRFSGLALTWRGEFRLLQGDYSGARDDFNRSLPLALHRDRNLNGLAAAAAGLATKTDAASQLSFMQRGLDFLYKQSNPAAAAEQFRKVLQLNATHYGATYQLASALDRQGRKEEARAVWEKVLGMATAYRDERTAQAARTRLAAR